jgi:hypothetical protein
MRSTLLIATTTAFFRNFLTPKRYLVYDLTMMRLHMNVYYVKVSMEIQILWRRKNYEKMD